MLLMQVKVVLPLLQHKVMLVVLETKEALLAEEVVQEQEQFSCPLLLRGAPPRRHQRVAHPLCERGELAVRPPGHFPERRHVQEPLIDQVN